MRTRRNIDCLSDDELHDLREAFAGLFALPASNPQSFANLAGFHGGPPTAYCRHGAPGFFTWHRAYLQAVEDALRSIRCDVVLPYWDWSSGPSTGVPAACRTATYVNRSGATVPNPLYAGPARSGGMTSRRPNIDTTAYDDLASQAQTAMGATDFGSFQNQMNNVHGGVHVRTGGDMGSVPTAAFDPIFYFHHANMDRLWASWQVSHPGALPAVEASSALDPFNRPFSTTWQTGADVESTTAMGYRYQRWCFYLPPIRIWDVIQLRMPWELRRDVGAARLLVRASAPAASVELRVFAAQPRATERTKTAGNAAFLGTITLFGGHGDEKVLAENCAECLALGHTHDHAAHVHSGHDHGAEEKHAGESGHGGSIELELDITEGLRALDVDGDDVPLKLVAIDSDGNVVRDDALTIEAIDLELD